MTEIAITINQLNEVHKLSNEALIEGMVLMVSEYIRRGNGNGMPGTIRELTDELTEIRRTREKIETLLTMLKAIYGDEDPGTLPPMS